MTTHTKINPGLLARATRIVALNQATGTMYPLLGRHELMDQNRPKDPPTLVITFSSAEELKDSLEQIRDAKGYVEFDGWPFPAFAFKSPREIRKLLKADSPSFARLHESTVALAVKISRADIVLAVEHGRGGTRHCLFGQELFAELVAGRAAEWPGLRVEELQVADAEEDGGQSLKLMRELVAMVRGERLVLPPA